MSYNKERFYSDPEYAETVRAKRKEAYQKLKADPVRMEVRKAKAREWYIRNREICIERSRESYSLWKRCKADPELYSSLSDKDRHRVDVLTKNQSERGRRYYAKHREELAAKRASEEYTKYIRQYYNTVVKPRRQEARTHRTQEDIERIRKYNNEYYHNVRKHKIRRTLCVN